MEGSTLIALWSRVNPVLSCAQLTEILGSPERKEGRGQLVVDARRTYCDVLRDDVTKQLHFQSPCGCLSDVDVHKNDWSLCRSHCGGERISRAGRAGVTARHAFHFRAHNLTQCLGCPISCLTFPLAGMSTRRSNLKKIAL